MNEFTRKAMELADQYENSGRCYLSASPKNAERLRARRDEIRTALLAHLEGAEVPEQDPEMLEAMKESNKWHFVDDIVPVLKAARACEWQWWANSRCKYIELRIDMRDLGCIIRDREKVRISPATLAYQYSKGIPATPTEEQHDR